MSYVKCVLNFIWNCQALFVSSNWFTSLLEFYFSHSNRYVVVVVSHCVELAEFSSLNICRIYQENHLGQEIFFFSTEKFVTTYWTLNIVYSHYLKLLNYPNSAVFYTYILFVVFPMIIFYECEVSSYILFYSWYW